MVEKDIKKCSTSSFIRETQIKTTLRFYPIAVRMAKIKNSGDRTFKERGTLLHCWWNWYNHSGNQSGIYPKDVPPCHKGTYYTI
jgi:hypothetical protein